MDILDSTINWLSGVYDSASGHVQSWSQEWQNAVDSFKQKAKNFLSLFEEMKSKQAIAQSDPTLAKEYASLMSKGQWLYDAIASVAQKIDSLNSLSLNSMGAIQLVPVAIIAGTVAAITAWMSKAYIVKQKLDSAERLAAQGHDPTSYLESFNDGPLFGFDGGSFKTLGLLFIGGIIIYSAWPAIQKALK